MEAEKREVEKESSKLRSRFLGPSGARVTSAAAAAAAAIRLSTPKVYKVDALEWFLTGIVHPDLKSDIANRSGRSRAAGSCLETV